MMEQKIYWGKEWKKIEKREGHRLAKMKEKKPFVLTEKIEEKIPEKVQNTLKQAFLKAFEMVLEKGSIVIEKTYNKKELEQNFEINQFALDLKNNRKAAKVFSKKAKLSSAVNVTVSGVKGAGLGFFGIGVPDIPIFVTMLFRSIYEISLHYGYDYDVETEKYFILLLIQGSLSVGEEYVSINEKVNQFIETKETPDDYNLAQELQLTSDSLANELICAKFIQGIPVVGTVGGLTDVVFMEKILKYVKLKYERRFVFGKL